MLTLHPSKEKHPSDTILSDRLCAIAHGLPEGGVICDVGSDHGTLPLYMLQKGLCRRAIVTDLNAAPLNRAKEALCHGGVGDRAEFFLTDGIAEIVPYSPDAYVIAGMGGDTVANILQRGLSGLKKGAFFALQPMTKEDRLRSFLYENGFLVQEERAVAENGKIFLILFARYDGVRRPISDFIRLVGEFLPQKKDEASRQYISKVKRKLLMRINGLISASDDNSDEVTNLRALVSSLEENHEDS